MSTATGFKRMGSKERLTYPCHQGKVLRKGGPIPRESVALIVIWGDIECRWQNDPLPPDYYSWRKKPSLKVLPR